MRRMPACLVTCCLAVLVAASMATPALATGPIAAARPWHYWVAPFLLIGAVISLIGWGVTYYFRVVGGRSRR